MSKFRPITIQLHTEYQRTTCEKGKINDIDKKQSLLTTKLSATDGEKWY